MDALPYRLDIKRDDLGNILSMLMPRPSNFHAHLRRGRLMEAVARAMMRWVLYLLVMPNTGPIRTVAEAEAYYNEAMEIARREGFLRLRLLMTLYHTDEITPATVEEIARSAVVYAIKHYPPEPGVTTGSGESVPLEESDEMLSAMEEWRVPLLGHFAITKDRSGRKLSPLLWEAEYVNTRLWRLRDKYPDLRICCEHASTREMVDFVKADTSGNTVMTATPHHLFLPNSTLTNRSWGRLAKCQPILQTPENMEAVREFTVSGDERVIAGDDCAPHPASSKSRPFDECSNGAYTPHAIPMYVKVFEDAGALDQRFINVMCLNGPRWWGLPPPALDDTIRIRAESEHDIPEPDFIPGAHDYVLPLGWSKEPDRLKIGFVCEEV